MKHGEFHILFDKPHGRVARVSASTSVRQSPASERKPRRGRGLGSPSNHPQPTGLCYTRIYI